MPDTQTSGGNGQMSTTQEDLSKLQEEVKGLEVMQAGQTATIAGAQMTQAAAQAGTWSTMMAGGVGLVVGMFLGMGIIRAARD
jgi:hypothetical protein